MGDSQIAEKRTEPLRLNTVLECARTITAREGLQALSMRHLADELGVWPTSVYHALGDRNKGDLVELMVDDILGGIAHPEPGPWEQQLRAWCSGFFDALAAHPGVAEFLMARGGSGPEGVRLSERLMVILTAAGLTGEERNRFLIGIYTLVITHAQGIAGSKPGDTPMVQGEDFSTVTTAAVSQVEPGEVPLAEQMIEWLIKDPVDAQYKWNLELMIDAVRTRGSAPS